MNRISQKFPKIEIINIHYTASFKQLIERISSIFEKDNSKYFFRGGNKI